MYFVGSGALWWTAPDDFSVMFTLVFFGIGLIGMEFATIFTNSYLPELDDDPAELGRISGSGWAFGYVGGLIALVIMLLLFQATASGTTMAGLTPLFGMDTTTKADTRIVGPLNLRGRRAGMERDANRYLWHSSHYRRRSVLLDIWARRPPDRPNAGHRVLRYYIGLRLAFDRHNHASGNLVHPHL